ncbi:MAG: site-2 protease family protein [Victivallales bacterium]|nr:site-2 protease family protein [Victivallales bacterium]
MRFFISYLWEDPYYFFTWTVLVIFAICCHEYMHARVALWQGDPTAAEAGHLTLNPLRQMGPFSILMLAVLGIAWGQVPVDPVRMRHRHSNALVSLAGPLTNLALCIVFCVLAASAIIIVGKSETGKIAAAFFFQGAMLNFVLFTFNMLPVPGFDGWHVLCAFFPRLKTSDSQAFYFVVVVIFLLGMKYISYLFLLGSLVSNYFIYLLVLLARMSGVQV